MTRHYDPVIKKLAQDNFYDLESVAPELMNQIIGDGVTMHEKVTERLAKEALGGEDSLTVQFKKWPIERLERLRDQKGPFAEIAQKALENVSILDKPTNAECSELWKAYMKILTVAAPK
jgi:hypothetical protein